MPLTIAAQTLEELAHGRLPERRRLFRATVVLIDRYRTALPRACADQGILFDALGLLNHASGGSLPALSERGIAHTLQLANDVRRLSVAEPQKSLDGVAEPGCCPASSSST